MQGMQIILQMNCRSEASSRMRTKRTPGVRSLCVNDLIKSFILIGLYSPFWGSGISTLPCSRLLALLGACLSALLYKSTKRFAYSTCECKRKGWALGLQVLTGKFAYGGAYSRLGSKVNRLYINRLIFNSDTYLSNRLLSYV